MAHGRTPVPARALRLALGAAGLALLALAGCGGGAGGDPGPAQPEPAPSAGTVTLAPNSELAAITLGDAQQVVQVAAGEKSTHPIGLLSREPSARFDVSVADGAAIASVIEHGGRWHLQVDARALAAGSSHLYRLLIRSRANASVSEVRGPIRVLAPTVAARAQFGEAGGVIVSGDGSVRFVFEPAPGATQLGVTLLSVPSAEGTEWRLRFDRDVAADERQVRFESAVGTPAAYQHARGGLGRAAGSIREALTPGFGSWDEGLGWFSVPGGYRLDHAPQRLNRLARATCRLAALDPTPTELLDLVCFRSGPAWRLSSPFTPSNVAGRRGEPVLLVHGYSPGSDLGGGTTLGAVSCLGLLALGAPCDTWGELPTLLLDAQAVTVTPFEFQWATNAPFELVADDLAQAVDRIHGATGRRVTLVAHSFGGLLVRTMLQGLGRRQRAAALRIPSKVSQVITIGTPHSGISLLPKRIEGQDLPTGRDTLQGGELVELCGQVSCHQAGEAVLSPIHAELVDVPAEAGALIARLANAPLPQGIPFTAAIGLARRTTLAGPGNAFGDGLISFDGQRFSPALAAGGGSQRNHLRCSPAQFGAAVQELVLGPNRDALPLDPLTSNDLGFLHSGAQVTFYPKADNRFEVHVDASGHPAYQLILDALLGAACPLAPVFEVQPADLTVAAGQDALFEAAARGSPMSMSYQWQRDGQDIPGATGPTLRLGAVGPGEDGARIRVVAANAAASAASREARLSVTGAPPPPPPVDPLAAKGRLATCSGPCVLAMKADGALVAAGRDPDLNDFHSLGNPGVSAGPWFTLAAAPAARFIDTGSGNTFIAARDGSLWVSGNGAYGSTGTGGNGITVDTWTRIPGLSDVRSVVGSAVASYALTGAGQLWVTGSNTYGQFGMVLPGAQIFSYQWVPVPALADVRLIASDGLHALALRSDRSVWAAGQNSRGSESILGFGSTANIINWTAVPGLANVIDVATGFAHSLAVTEDGGLWATGGSQSSTWAPFGWTPQTAFARVPGIDGVRAVAAGAFCSMALKADGSLWVAGLFNYSSSGLGVGAPNLLSTWQGVSSLPPVVAMQTDCNRSLAITADGRLWVAGDNTGGALGFGDPQRDFTAPGTLPVWTLVESHAGF